MARYCSYTLEYSLFLLFNYRFNATATVLGLKISRRPLHRLPVKSHNRLLHFSRCILILHYPTFWVNLEALAIYLLYFPRWITSFWRCHFIESEMEKLVKRSLIMIGQHYIPIINMTAKRVKMSWCLHLDCLGFTFAQHGSSWCVLAKVLTSEQYLPLQGLVLNCGLLRYT